MQFQIRECDESWARTKIAFLALVAGAALIACATTDGTIGFGGYLSGSGCIIRTATADFTDDVAHSLQCGSLRNRSAAGDMMVVCAAGQRMAGVKSPAFGTDTVEVTYRFDDQPAVREQWALSEGLALSPGAADPILDGLATADRLVFRVGRGGVGGKTTEIVGLTDFGARAVATFLQRCVPPSESAESAAESN